MTHRIVRTVAEYEDLHADTVLLNCRGNIIQAVNIWPHRDLPAVMLATGDEFQAAGKALEEA